MQKRKLLKLMNFWPPFLGAGIKVDYIDPHFNQIDVSMKLKFWNRNYVNTHYGGSLYSMTDPFIMLMLIEKMGKNYIVWDKAASIKFIKPGTGKVHTQFKVTDEMVEKFKEQCETHEKIHPTFIVEVKNESDEVVCVVEKVLYIKKKKPK